MDNYRSIMEQMTGGMNLGRKWDGNDVMRECASFAPGHVSLNGAPQSMEHIMKGLSTLAGGAGGGGKIGVAMGGVTTNEKGKRVARAGMMTMDTATGKVETGFHEKQLDPNDPE